eukprot:Platyproteum_vivax@DN1183_c0_g1_i1.p1
MGNNNGARPTMNFLANLSTCECCRPQFDKDSETCVEDSGLDKFRPSKLTNSEVDNLVEEYFKKNPNTTVTEKVGRNKNRPRKLTKSQIKNLMREFVAAYKTGVDVNFVLDDGQLVQGICCISDDLRSLILQVNEKSRGLNLSEISDVYEGAEPNPKEPNNDDERATAVFSDGMFVTLKFANALHRYMFLTCLKVLGDCLD